MWLAYFTAVTAGYRNNADQKSRARWCRSKRSSSPSPTNTFKKKKKTHLHVKWLTKNIKWMLAEELKPPKRVINSWHNWVEQKKKSERKNQEGTSIPEREVWRWKGTHLLGSHLIDGKISWVKGTSKVLIKVQQLGWEQQRRMRTAKIIWTIALDTTAWEDWAGAGHWDSGTGGWSQGEDWVWQCGDSLRG